MTPSFEQTSLLLERALRTIPLGAQTFSKSKTQFPLGVSPLFADSAKGAELTDVDGNVYVDFINALAAVSIGYADPEINAAVSAQLARGVTFSLSTALEADVAERIVALVPCAEQVRFGKNGSDATTAAVRLARACTGRERVAVCGYHGWQDWTIGTTTRDLGVPGAVKALSHTFRFNDAESLDAVLAAHPGEFAAVILEPLGAVEPAAGFLESVADQTRQAGALLIFDETVTGFRVHIGGAQALYGVTPDLATFGKGLANGFPLSAVVGPQETMRRMEDIFFSTTFGGETLSLAAARVVLDRLVDEKVPEQLARRGDSLKQGIAQIVSEAACTDVFSISGHPSWSFLGITGTDAASPYAIRTLLLQELFARGFLSLGTHNLSAAHTMVHIDGLLRCYADVLPMIAARARGGHILEALRAEPLVPLFSVR
ncbi:MAG: aminotransferase class III-fold pyridoxal phosphate-dependent enzyme [Gammaproteobacteria bacterium]|jgi:glutamate-1-semialdehyde aminotransferase